MTSAPLTGEAILLIDARGIVFIGAWKKWSDRLAWWAVLSKPYFAPTQVEIVNPQGWQPIPGREE